MDLQARVPPALCALHNFIGRRDPSDIEDYSVGANLEAAHIQADDPEIGDLALHALTPADREHADVKREQIANAMWDDYQRIVRERGDVFENAPDVSD